jgi:hypothetical protein
MFATITHIIMLATITPAAAGDLQQCSLRLTLAALDERRSAMFASLATRS